MLLFVCSACKCINAKLKHENEHKEFQLTQRVDCPLSLTLLANDVLLNSRFVSSVTENFTRSKFSLSLTILTQFLPFLIAAFNVAVVLMPKSRSPLHRND